MYKKTILKINGYKAIRNQFRIELGKIVLYGPNGAGKSSIIEVTSALLGNDELFNYDAIHDNFYLEILSMDKNENFLSSGKIVRKEGDKYLITIEKRGGKRRDELTYSLPSAFEVLSSELRLKKSIALIDSCSISANYSGRSEQLNICLMSSSSDTDFSFLGITDLVKFEKILFDAFEIDGPKLASRNKWMFMQNGEWIPVESLAYGFKRSILMLLAVIISEALFIESFEAGLHIDLASNLLHYLTAYGNDKTIVLETHSGIIMTLATLDEKWKAYYLENGEAIKELKNIEDLRDTSLYKKEYESYITKGVYYHAP